MRIIVNESAYDTRAVRRIIQVVVRAFARRESRVRGWPEMRVSLREGRTQRIRITASHLAIVIYLPPLQGTEFIGLVRQQHGGAQGADHGGLEAKALALVLQTALYRLLGHAPQWVTRTLMDGGKMLRRIPELVPLRVIKPPPVRDKLRERLTRTLELQKSWRRKSKLATTKLKKLGSLQRRYEKQLVQRQVGAP